MHGKKQENFHHGIFKLSQLHLKLQRNSWSFSISKKFLIDSLVLVPFPPAEGSEEKIAGI